MKRFLAAILIGSALLGSAVPTLAKSKGGSSKKSPSLDGVLSRVTKAKLIVTTGNGDPDRAIILAGNTKYTKNGQAISYEDLAEGQHVTITLIGNVAAAVAVQ